MQGRSKGEERAAERPASIIHFPIGALVEFLYLPMCSINVICILITIVLLPLRAVTTKARMV